MSVAVFDPFGVCADPELPTLARAIDPAVVADAFRRGLPRLAGDEGGVCIREIRVTRWKPGRRCVVEYDVDVERADRPPEGLTLIGKVRRRRSGSSAHRLNAALWDAGFAADAHDGISVPEPVGALPELRLWLQRKVPGRVATELLAEPGGEALARRIAEAAHKVHRAGVPRAPERRHTMADELRILGACLPHVARLEPRWRERIERVLDACIRLGDATPPSPSRWIHRDFYGDQVIVDGDRLWLIDFDQYCRGDPAVDAGNFLGCMADHSLRIHRDPDALAEPAAALEARFLELSGDVRPEAVHAYALLTLVRHVYVSTQIRGRGRFTGELLALSEERVGVAEHAPAPRQRIAAT